MSIDFLYGFVSCMCADVVFSICNFFLQRAFKLRAERRLHEKQLIAFVEEHVMR